MAMGPMCLRHQFWKTNIFYKLLYMESTIYSTYFVQSYGCLFLLLFFTNVVNVDLTHNFPMHWLMCLNILGYVVTQCNQIPFPTYGPIKTSLTLMKL